MQIAIERVMELEGWDEAIKQCSGAYGAGDAFPSPEQVVLKQVVRVVGAYIDFTCKVKNEDRIVHYDYTARDEKTALRLAEILQRHIGEILSSIGMLEISSD